MLFQVAQLLRRATLFQVRRCRAEYPAIAHQAPTDMLAGDIVAHADLQVEALADDVHHSVEQVQAGRGGQGL